jgi:hypothetical protein
MHSRTLKGCVRESVAALAQEGVHNAIDTVFYRSYSHLISVTLVGEHVSRKGPFGGFSLLLWIENENHNSLD